MRRIFLKMSSWLQHFAFTLFFGNVSYSLYSNVWSWSRVTKQHVVKQKLKGKPNSCFYLLNLKCALFFSVFKCLSMFSFTFMEKYKWINEELYSSLGKACLFVTIFSVSLSFPKIISLFGYSQAYTCKDYLENTSRWESKKATWLKMFLTSADNCNFCSHFQKRHIISATILQTPAKAAVSLDFFT